MLQQNGIERIIDIRLRNTNQLAGFSKKQDLQFFLDKLLGIEYYHWPFLAPTDDILDNHRKGGSWERYVERFTKLMEERKVLDRLNPEFFREKSCCLLCSEHVPDECHRRLIAEMLAQAWGNVTVMHLISRDKVIRWTPD